MFAWLTVDMSDQICVLWHTYHGQVSRLSSMLTKMGKETNRAGYSIQKSTPDSSEAIQSITLAFKVSAVSPHWKLVERRC